MATHITKYETKNGKTRRVPSAPKAEKKDSPGGKPGDTTTTPPVNPLGKGA